MEKSQAIEKLKRQTTKINDLKNKERFSPDHEKWRRDTEVAIERIFGSGTRHLKDFKKISYSVGIITSDTTDHELHEAYVDGLEHAAMVLSSFMEEIEEYWPDTPKEAVKEIKPEAPMAKKVFVVHGHHDAYRETLARFLEKLGLEPIILHEQPNEGKTIIEKFIDYSDVAFAVVLLTADDRGGNKSIAVEKQSLRARQNVILELGFFLGRLGRNHVCPLYEEGVEIPSDYQGVVFVPLDKAGAWKLILARELKAAGLPVDMNDVT